MAKDTKYYGRKEIKGPSGSHGGPYPVALWGTMQGFSRNYLGSAWESSVSCKQAHSIFYNVSLSGGAGQPVTLGPPQRFIFLPWSLWFLSSIVTCLSFFSFSQFHASYCINGVVMYHNTPM